MIERYRVAPGKRIRLTDFDPADTSPVAGGKKEGEKLVEKLGERLDELQDLLYAGHDRKLLVVLQGMDTSGKDGTVRHVMGGFDPQGVQVISFKKPTPTELEHDYLWRVHAHTPGSGEVVIFNRSHYEDVLVVRVHELVPEKVWSKRYRHINEFERMLAQSGTTILKFFLHISADEQKKRLKERLEQPDKRWKFAVGDLEERKLWREYQEAYEVAINETSTKWAPWYIVPANTKWYRNYVVGTIVRDTMRKLKMEYPQPEIGNVVIE
ncbi:MAG: polyphosphate kinase 2 family protein [Thermoanaerobaculia bacterium]